MTESLSPAALPRSALSVPSYFLIAAGIYLFTAGWGIWGQSISNPEEARYACAARTMLRDHDWLVPKFNGGERIVKPILFYWLICAAGKIGEVTGLGLVTGMRLVPLFAGLGTVAATFLIVRKLSGGSVRAAFVAAVVLTTCFEFHKLARELIIDMTMTAFLTGAWYFVLEALDRIASNRRTFFALLGFFFCLGLACMAKGPLVVAGFVVLPLVVYLIMTKQLSALARAGLWWGVPLTCALGFWWFAVRYFQGHPENAWVFFMEENRDRIVGEKDHVHPFPWFYYFTFLPEGLTLWILPVPLLIWRAFSADRKGAPWLPNNAFKAVFCALVVSFLIIGLSASKRKNYLLPLYPHFAVWAGLMFNASFESDNSDRALATASVRRVKFVYAALSVAVLATFAYEIFVMPAIEKRSNNAAFYAAVRKELNGRRLVTLNESANEAVWYLDLETPIVKLNFPALKEKFFEAKETVLLLKERDLDTTEGLKPALQLIDGFHMKRDKEPYFLATPNPDKTPDAKIFERRTKGKGKDTDSGEE